MASDRLFIGIDSGTQGTKGVVLSEKKRKIIAQASYPYGLIENDRGGREQEPRKWLEACKSVLKTMLADSNVDPQDVQAIGVSGQQHGMVPLDSKGNVLRPAKLWCDTETTAQCMTLTQRVGGEAAAVELVGNQFSAGFTASKILWLKENEPENYEKLAQILLPHDYINYWLTGNYAAENGDASGTAYFDVKKRNWSHRVLQAIDQGRDLSLCLPHIIESAEPCGIIRSELAEEFGLPRMVLVSSGGGDNMMAAIGTGNVIPGLVTASLGTSGTIFAHTERPVIDPSGELAAFCSSSGGWLPLVCTMNVTVATELVRSLLGFDLEQMNQHIEQTAAGSEGLMLIPYFNGERTPSLPSATATLGGMTSINMRPGPIARAAMEGATFGLRYGLDVMLRNGIMPDEIRLVGGGSHSPVWRQLVADIFRYPVVCLDHEEAGAMGAAIQALWCTESTLSKDPIELKEITELYVAIDGASKCLPHRETSTKYTELYDRYTAFGDCLIQSYHDL
ncbi:MAG: xylulokinase [Desulfobacterales bacterium]|nr:xylulokinase [Desulfobacterales bacterium]